MAKYVVWDPGQEDEARASTYEAPSPDCAAERYAEEDVDGNGDGVYAGRGCRIHVRQVEGELLKFNVTVDYDLVYYASPVEE